MSMRDYSYVDYGLVLDEQTVKHMYNKAFDGREEEWEDMLYALYDEGICEYAGDFTGEAIGVDDDGSNSWNDTIVYNNDMLYYVPLRKYPSLFHKAYDSIIDIINELKENIGQYMPEGYNYRANIRHIVGTTFG